MLDSNKNKNDNNKINKATYCLTLFMTANSWKTNLSLLRYASYYYLTDKTISHSQEVNILKLIFSQFKIEARMSSKYYIVNLSLCCVVILQKVSEQESTLTCRSILSSPNKENHKK